MEYEFIVMTFVCVLVMIPILYCFMILLRQGNKFPFCNVSPVGIMILLAFLFLSLVVHALGMLYSLLDLEPYPVKIVKQTIIHHSIWYCLVSR